MKKEDFELVPSSRGPAITPEYCETDKPVELAGALADNMGNIIELARDIAEIMKIKVQSEVLISTLDKKKELIVAEAEAYVKIKTANNKGTVDKMERVRLILKDYYQYNVDKEALSGEVFAQIITEALRG